MSCDLAVGAASVASETVSRKEEENVNDPSFIFLQLYSSRFLGDISDTPILLPANEVLYLRMLNVSNLSMKECKVYR